MITLVFKAVTSESSKSSFGDRTTVREARLPLEVLSPSEIAQWIAIHSKKNLESMKGELPAEVTFSVELSGDGDYLMQKLTAVLAALVETPKTF